jgi:uncharacterized membrane protein YdbT with pleckstrin-like domain
MGYVDENLIADEVVTYRARLHWTVLIVPVLVAALCVLSAVVVVQSTLQLRRPVAAVVLVVGLVPLVRSLIRRSAAEFAVTNKRVIFKAGVVDRKTAEMFLNKIESVGVDQTIAGRIFGYGSVILRGTGGSTEPFDMVARPLELRRQVQEQIGKLFERK